MRSNDSTLDRWIAVGLLAAVVSSLVSIALSDTLLGVVILLWIADCWRQRRVCLKAPPFAGLVLGFFAVCVAAVLLSSDPASSAPYLKKFVKFLYVFLLFTYVRLRHVEPALRALFVVLGISAVYGIVQYFWIMDVNLVNRIEGFMGHWMTFSGQLMMGSVGLAGYLLFYRLPRAHLNGRRDEWLKTAAWIALLALFLFVIILTFTRNAWVGTAGGLFLLLWMYGRRWFLGGALTLVVVFVSLPVEFHQRIYSSFDPNDMTTRIRLELLETGKNVITAHPWTGLGPNMVPVLYQEYNGTNEFPSWIYQHLHNNFVHIAAEMGLFALVVWTAIWVFVLRDFRQFSFSGRASPFASSTALSAMAVVLAFLLAGLFEYNFGDSEILVLLLFWITVPYVVYRERHMPA